MGTDLRLLGNWATVSAWLAMQHQLRRQRRRRLLLACCDPSAVSIREQVRSVERILDDLGVRPRLERPAA